MNRLSFLKSMAILASSFPMARLSSATSEQEVVKNNTTLPQITRRRYKDTNVTLPLLGYGMMRLPKKDGKIDYKKAQELVDRAMKSGLNYFDTAWPYHSGESENFVGAALQKYPRESYILADKLPIWKIKTKEDARKTFETQLKKCKTSYFDFYLMHALDKTKWDTVENLKLFEFAEEMKKAGKIKHIGFSFHDTPDLLKKIVVAYKWDFALLQINYVDWVNYRSREQYEIVSAKGIPIMVMEPLRGGSLATLTPEAEKILKAVKPDVSLASWALRYVASLPNVICMLSGMSKMEHLEDNLKTLSPFVPLSDDERLTLDSALAAYKKTDSVPCTACHYCVPCPAEVRIPRIFGIFNRYKINGDKEAFKKDLAALNDGGPQSCVECGACIKKCPQHIDIPSDLKRIVGELQKV